MREELKKLIIEQIHGESWEDSIATENDSIISTISSYCYHCETDNEELKDVFNYDSGMSCYYYPITIGRVMQALPTMIKKENKIWSLTIGTGLGTNNAFIAYEYLSKVDPWEGTEKIDWKLIEEGKELTLDDQSDETISALLKLLK